MATAPTMMGRAGLLALTALHRRTGPTAAVTIHKMIHTQAGASGRARLLAAALADAVSGHHHQHIHHAGCGCLHTTTAAHMAARGRGARGQEEADDGIGSDLEAALEEAANKGKKPAQASRPARSAATAPSAASESEEYENDTPRKRRARALAAAAAAAEGRSTGEGDEDDSDSEIDWADYDSEEAAYAEFSDWDEPTEYDLLPEEEQQKLVSSVRDVPDSIASRIDPLTIHERRYMYNSIMRDLKENPRNNIIEGPSVIRGTADIVGLNYDGHPAKALLDWRNTPWIQANGNAWSGMPAEPGPNVGYCIFCYHGTSMLKEENTTLLSMFVTRGGKIMGKRFSGACAKHQRKLARTIKRARDMQLMPYQSQLHPKLRASSFNPDPTKAKRRVPVKQTEEKFIDDALAELRSLSRA